MEESIYSTLCDSYFSALVDPGVIRNKSEYERQIENYSSFLSRLERQHTARQEDIIKVEESIKELNAKANVAQNDIIVQDEESKKVQATNDLYAKTGVLIEKKFHTPIELRVQPGSDSSDDAVQAPPTIITTTLHHDVEQYAKNQKTLEQAIIDSEKEAELDMADFYDRLDDLNAISRISESFQRKYQQPRQASSVEDNDDESSLSEDESQGELSNDENMQDTNQESDDDL